jgi:TldD protein
MIVHQQAESILLEPTALSEGKLLTVVSNMLGAEVDFAELYFQQHQAESWTLEDNLVKDASFSIEAGVGARVLSGEKCGFAYADDLSLIAIEQAAQAARSIAYHQGNGIIRSNTTLTYPRHYQSVNPIISLDEAQKIDLLHKIDQLAHQLDPRVIKVTASLSAAHDVVLMMASDGQTAADIRPLVRLGVSIIVEQHGRRESGYAGGGGRTTYQYFLEEDRYIDITKEAVRVALLNLEAQPAPAGVMPIVMAPGWSGVLLHEAVGHGLEADFNRKGSSTFASRLGEQVASALVTVIDDGTMPNRRGSLSVDDEGTPTQATVLIENGILKNYLQDKHNAKLMKRTTTGNGRRQSYADLPMPRMTNTYMQAGQHFPQEIISSLDKGLYVVGLGSGSVDITSGKFVFVTNEAYYVEQGKILYPVKGATLVGSGPEVMQKISMVGNDLEFDAGIGICGKEGQSVPVGVGQPTIRVEGMTIGGTQK